MDKLIDSPIEYFLCSTEKIFKKMLRKIGLPKKQWPDFILNAQSNATTHFFSNGGETIAIVCIRTDRNKDIKQTHALLCHEAVHIWQEIKEDIGEKNPGWELEAYAIQGISQELFYEYERQIGGEQVNELWKSYKHFEKRR